MELHFCPVCGEKLTLRQHPTDGPVAFCAHCGDWRFPLFSTAVSVAVLNGARTHILLIRQYGEAAPVLPAGYVDKGETAEAAVRRELQEELGMTVRALRFRRSRWYAPSETLMLHYSALVNETEARPNWEVDGWEWVPVAEARARVACADPDDLAAQLLDDTFGEEEQF